MTSIQKSMRIPREMIEGIQGIARERNKDFSTVTKELLEEAIKMHRCPGIVFSEGVRGRRARIAGTGIEVWEVIASYKGMGESLERLKTAFHWLSEPQLRAALVYYRAYPEEIDGLMSQNQDWTWESIYERFPFLAGSRE
jgi:uncharacterized protein (DUF433 family)